MKKRQRQSTTISEFSQKVYDAVSQIPKGQVRTYKDIARAIGAPLAYRAVGNALNKNPYIGQVPCHRVIRSDGSIGGFVKGEEVKKKLLLVEKERGIK
jgi:O-6-methylguanine DNA methyltransferase